jgi:hypothetical protein
MRLRTILSFSHLNTYKIKKGTQSTFIGFSQTLLHEDMFEVAVQAKLFVSYALLSYKISFAEKLLQVSAFDTDFGNRKHGLMQERRIKKSGQFYKVLKP